MRTAVQWVRAQIYHDVVAAGFEDLGRFHVGMFSFPTPDGLRPTVLADQLGITKQSVNNLLRDLEGRGYLHRVPDPTDGRARVIHLTAKGRRLEAVVYDAAEAAEQGIAELLGPRRFAQFRRSLEEVAGHIASGELLIHRRGASSDSPS
ncbi:MAG: MarR family winged helix-turn-helix transcriptional regulator [Acidimicrobiales bacterium]